MFIQSHPRAGRDKDQIRRESAQTFCEENCLQKRILVRAKETRGHLSGMLKGFAPKGTPFSSCGDDHVAILKCLISGFFGNAAKLSSSGNYLTVRGGVAVTTHPTSIISRSEYAATHLIIYYFHYSYDSMRHFCLLRHS